MQKKYWVSGSLISLLIFLITYFNIYNYYHLTHFKIVAINSAIFLVCGGLLGILLDYWKHNKFTKKFIIGASSLILTIILSVMGTYMATSCDLKYFPSPSCLIYFNTLILFFLVALILLSWAFCSKIIIKLKS